MMKILVQLLALFSSLCCGGVAAWLEQLYSAGTGWCRPGGFLMGGWQ